MSKPYNSRKHALECMRLASECMQLAHDVESQNLRSHYVEMAKEWSALANGGQIPVERDVVSAGADVATTAGRSSLRGYH